ncbi:MAG: tetratricopeptide repeat protein, partial [Planctomycetes bacterium]|nr:tetratricopeptide repeat protein [Planctomycetota bacterium]
KLERHWVGRAGEAAEAAYRIQDALRFYQRLTEILAAGASEQIRVRCRITDLLMQLDRTTEALPLADKAVVDARQLNDVRLEATALSALGAAVRDGTRNTESVDYFRNSVSLFRKTDDEAGLAKALLGLAGSLWTKGQLDDAEHAATEACEIADRSADTKTRAGAWMNRLGIVLHAQRFEEAESLIAKLAIIVGDSPDPALRMRLHAFRGYAMDVMGHHDEARSDYDKTIELAREIGNKAEVARSQTNLASLDANEKRYAQARARHVEAERVARELGDLRIAAYACAGQAAIDEALGDYRSSLERYYAAIRIGRKLGMNVILPAWSISAGLTHAELGDWDAATELLLKYRGNLHLGLEAGRLGALGIYEARSGNAQRGIELAQQARDILPDDYEIGDPLPRQWVERASKLLD